MFTIYLRLHLFLCSLFLFGTSLQGMEAGSQREVPQHIYIVQQGLRSCAQKIQTSGVISYEMIGGYIAEIARYINVTKRQVNALGEKVEKGIKDLDVGYDNEVSSDVLYKRCVRKAIEIMKNFSPEEFERAGQEKLRKTDQISSDQRRIGLLRQMVTYLEDHILMLEALDTCTNKDSVIAFMNDLSIAYDLNITWIP